MVRFLILSTTMWAMPGASSAIAGPPASPASGLRKGEEVSAWEPVHVAGPHAGTKTCPVCTYLEAPVLMAFARDLAAAEALATPLEQIAEAHAAGKLRVVLVVLDAPDDKLRRLAEGHKIRRVMLCRPDPERRGKQLAAYKIEPSVTNTVLIYENFIVKHSWVSLAASELHMLVEATGPYLPKR